MYTIGEFASFARVSVRMLRHWDAVALLPPQAVDPHNGYRLYGSDQLGRLFRIVELRNLGIGLDAIGRVLDSADADAALREVLASRRAELVTAMESDAHQLARLDERLRRLEGITMSIDVIYRAIDPVTVYATSGIAPGMGPENVGPVVGPLIGALDSALETAGRPIIEPSIFWYVPAADGEAQEVHISYHAEAEPVPGDGYDVVALPAVATAATALHRGDMTGIGDTWMELIGRLAEDGYRISGSCREVYLVADGHEPGPNWVTELQVPVEKA